MHEQNDITADLNVNVNAFERRLAARASWSHKGDKTMHASL